MRRFGRKVVGRLGRDKAGEATTPEKTVPQIHSATGTTESIAPEASSSMKTTGAASPGRKPDLYSTDGSNGIKVVAEPNDAVLEYV
jgi:hypothetical protein